MLTTVVTTISVICLSLSLVLCAVVALRWLVGLWRLREVRRAMAEMRTLEDTRAYVAWVRNPPPPPARQPPDPPIVAVPVVPPVRGAVRPFPGRRLVGR
jgi:hypothetical protein